MGMDVFGNEPKSENGEYFRNNVWWWRPLWDYCTVVAEDLVADVDGHSNGGDGLDAKGAAKLAELLQEEIATGRTYIYEAMYRNLIASKPREVCTYCEGTGIRTDTVGQEMGMPERKLDDSIAVIVGRERGWCNGCQGEGLRDPFDANYPFDVENVQKFVEFLKDSGGFKIC
jgi:hypothetical protein